MHSHNGYYNYKNAPISEVVFGLTFREPILGYKSLIFEVISELKRKYSIVLMTRPLANESLTGFQHGQITDPSKTGAALYRLLSPDNHWMVQVQSNKIIFNWVRLDERQVGDYPGFNNIYKEFLEVFNEISEIFNKNEAPRLDQKILYHELVYQNRFPWENYIDTLSEMNKIIALKLPEIFATNEKKLPPNNIFSQYTYPIDEIDGFGVLTINTGTSDTLKKQMIIFECKLIGKSSNFEEWFEKSHQIQLNTFKNLFTPTTLESWK